VRRGKKKIQYVTFVIVRNFFRDLRKLPIVPDSRKLPPM